MTSAIMGLAADEFWTAPERTRNEVAAQVSASDWRGYAIDAPAVVDIGVRDTLPVLGVRCLSAVDSAAYDFQRNAVLVAVRLESNEVFVNNAFEQKYTAPNLKARAAPSPTITITDTFSFEARERLPAMPWVPGTYRVHLVVLDQSADPVDVKLTVPSGPPLYTPPSRDAASPAPGVGAPPVYARVEASPAVPMTSGISMVGDRVVLLTAGSWCMLQGSFRLPVTARDVPAWSDANDEPTLERIAIDPNAIEKAPKPPEPPAAYVPITFVLTSAALTGPWVCTVVLPSKDTPLAVGDTVTGYFSFNLFDLPEFPRVPGTYHLWAYSGPVVAGPEPIALVLEERLAPP